MPANSQKHVTTLAAPGKPPTSKKKGGKEYSKDAIAKREIASVNTTVNAFVGGKQRAWMSSAPSATPSNVQTMSRKRSVAVAANQPESATPTTNQSHPAASNYAGPRGSQLAVSTSTTTPFAEATDSTTQSDGIGAVQVLPSPAPSEGRPSPAATSLVTPETIIIDDSSQASQSSPREYAGQLGVETTSISTLSRKQNVRAAEESADNNPKRRKLEINAGVAAGTQTATQPTPLTPVTSPGLMNRPVHHWNVSNCSTSVGSASIPAPPSNPVRMSLPGSIMIPTSSSTYRQIQSPRSVVPNPLSPQQVQNQQHTAQHSNLHLASQTPQPAQHNGQNTQQSAHGPCSSTGNLPPGSRRTSIVRNSIPNSPTIPLTGMNGHSPTAYNQHQFSTPYGRPSVAGFLDSVGGFQLLLPTEKLRIEWILHALAGHDWGFLILHQLYCLSATNRSFLDQRNLVPPEAFVGFNFVGKILNENQDVSQHLLDYFSRFPDLIQIQIGYPSVLTIIRDLVLFLTQGPLVYTEILNRCVERRTSPTAEELAISPFTCSVIIQRLVWRSIRLHLDEGLETSSGAELEKQFILQQFNVLKSRGFIPPPHATQGQQWWLAQQQHAQIQANQQAIQNKFPELNRPLQLGVTYPVYQISPTFQQRPPLQQLRPSSHLSSAPMAIQDGSQQQSNQNVNGGINLVTLQPGAQAGQHIPQFHQGQANQVQLEASSTSQSSIVQSPLASTVHTPRLPGNFGQTSVGRIPNALTAAHADVIGSERTTRSPLTSPPVQSLDLGRGPSVAPQVNSGDNYISVVGFATQISLPCDMPCLTQEFTVLPEVANRLSLWEPHPGMPGRLKRTVVDRSIIYRVRCVQAVKGKDDINEESNWVLRECTWPPHLFLQLNNNPIILRRKQTFNADLFADVTNEVKTGQNALKVVMLQEKGNLIPKNTFLLRVEVLEARSYLALVKHVIPRKIIDKDTAKSAILKRFKDSGDDDDVVIVKLSELTLSIVCPFTMGLIRIPVRGRSCLHPECFDLDNYLISRPRRRPKEPPNADSWKCPYCNGDARPTELIIDGFFMEMMNQIKEMKDIENAKEVVVKVDGSWEVKKEVASKGKDPEKKQESGEELRKQVEVITIDDD